MADDGAGAGASDTQSPGSATPVGAETPGPPEPPRRRGHPVLRYTLLRLGMFVVVLAVLWVFPPLRGLLAVILALLISGSIALFVLDRQRDSMSTAVSGFFGRINDRIDASTRAEDLDVEEDVEEDVEVVADADDARTGPGAGVPAAAESPSPSAEGQAKSQQQADD